MTQNTQIYEEKEQTVDSLGKEGWENWKVMVNNAEFLFGWVKYSKISCNGCISLTL
jgi:hypothetical protein